MTILYLIIFILILGLIDILSFAGIIKVHRGLLAYLHIALIPFIVTLIIPVWVITFCAVFFVEKGSKLISFFISVIAFEVLILSLFAYIKMNILPFHFPKKTANDDKIPRGLFSGKTLLTFSLFANLLYTISFLVITAIIIIKNWEEVSGFLSHFGQYLQAYIGMMIVGILMPFLALPAYIITILAALAGFIIGTIITILYAICIILSINGAIRIIVASKELGKKHWLKTCFLILPVVNIIMTALLLKAINRKINCGTELNQY